MKKNNRKSSKENGGSSKLPRNALTRTVKVVSAPVMQGRKVAVGTPKIQGSGSSIRVKFRELLSTTLLLTPTVGVFQLAVTVPINPGLPASFPWLSTMARNYDQYVVHNMQYDYVNAAPATKQGFVYMVVDYDAFDAPPGSAQQAMNQMGSRSGPVWTSLSMPIRVQAAMALGPRRFIRQGTTSRDLVTTDVGQLHVFVSDVDATPLPGQIWVEYDISFYAPQMIPTVRTVPTLTEMGGNTADANVPIDAPQAMRFGNPLAAVNGLGAKVVTDEVSWSLPPGAYQFIVDLTGQLTKQLGNNDTIEGFELQLLRETFKDGSLIASAVVDQSNFSVESNGSSVSDGSGLFNTTQSLRDDNRNVYGAAALASQAAATIIAYTIRMLATSGTTSMNWHSGHRNLFMRAM